MTDFNRLYILSVVDELNRASWESRFEFKLNQFIRRINFNLINYISH